MFKLLIFTLLSTNYGYHKKKFFFNGIFIFKIGINIINDFIKIVKL